MNTERDAVFIKKFAERLERGDVPHGFIAKVNALVSAKSKCATCGKPVLVPTGFCGIAFCNDYCRLEV